MATASEKARERLKSQGYSDTQINQGAQKVRAAQNSGTSTANIISDIKSNTSSYLGTPTTSSGSSGGGSGSSNSNSSSGDIYGDVGGNRSSATPMDFSNISGTIDESTLKFGTNAHAAQAKDSSYLAKRNNDIASYLYNQNKGSVVDEGKVTEYLSKFKDFTDAKDWEQKNTINAILARYGEVVKEKGDNGLTNKDTGVTGVDEGSINAGEGKAGMYLDADGNYYKIYGYDEMSDEYKGLADRMSESQKKELSNKWAQGMQDDVKYFLDSAREKDQLNAQQDIKSKLNDNDMEQFAIQTQQTLRNAEESYNNLKQNWQYLGNLGMPGTSSTKIQAIGDCISEAKTQLNELNKLLSLQKDAKELNWQGQVLKYTQQLDNIAYDLKWKVGDELTGLLSKFTTAELEGKLDTIDGITAFKRELLDDLDANLSGLTSASLSQMQYINQEYQKIADKAYEYAQNANTVNKDMSAVKGFYVDGNGNPILNNLGQPIEVPQSAPMEPVFDKETGRLITFAMDDNGQIVASVQQLWDTNSSVTGVQGQIATLIQSGASVGEILSAVPGADVKTISEVAKLMGKETITGGTSNEGWTTLGSDWSNGNQVKLGETATDTGIPNVYGSNVKLAPTVGAMLKSAYDYLKEQGIDLQIGDSYRSYATQKAAYEKDQALPADKRKGVAAPGKSFHEIGQAIDVAQSQMNDPKVLEALYAAGFTRPVASEPRHWSYGEGADAFGYATKKEDKSYDPTLSRYYENWFKLTKDDRANALKEYGLTLEQFNKQMNNYFDAIEKTEGIESILALRDKAQELLDWNKENSSKGNGSLHTGKYDLETFKNGSYSALGGLIQGQTKASEGAQMYNWLKNNQTLDKFIDAKKNGATFGAMSEGEWKILGDAASELTWETNDTKFEDTLQKMINTYNEKLKKLGVDITEKSQGSKREKQSGGNIN